MGLGTYISEPVLCGTIPRASKTTNGDRPSNPLNTHPWLAAQSAPEKGAPDDALWVPLPSPVSGPACQKAGDQWVKGGRPRVDHPKARRLDWTGRLRRQPTTRVFGAPGLDPSRKDSHRRVGPRRVGLACLVVLNVWHIQMSAATGRETNEHTNWREKWHWKEICLVQIFALVFS